MKKLLVLSLTMMLVQTGYLSAKDNKENNNFVYATYLNCDGSRQQELDAVMENEYAPVFNKAVADKVIKNWVWFKHHTGGNWRRLSGNTASSMKELFVAQDEISKRLEAAKVDEGNIYGSVCKSHEDYIWKVDAGSNTETRGAATLSVYMICNVADEERADEIVKTVFAPIYESNIGKGKLTSWGWLTHMIGGKYRRLLTFSAENYEDLLKTRGSILGTLYGEKGPAEAKEMNNICTSHQDYLWDS